MIVIQNEFTSLVQFSTTTTEPFLVTPNTVFSGTTMPIIYAQLANDINILSGASLWTEDSVEGTIFSLISESSAQSDIIFQDRVSISAFGGPALKVSGNPSQEGSIELEKPDLNLSTFADLLGTANGIHISNVDLTAFNGGQIINQGDKGAAVFFSNVAGSFENNGQILGGSSAAGIEAQNSFVRITNNGDISGAIGLIAKAPGTTILNTNNLSTNGGDTAVALGNDSTALTNEGTVSGAIAIVPSSEVVNSESQIFNSGTIVSQSNTGTISARSHTDIHNSGDIIAERGGNAITGFFDLYNSGEIAGNVIAQDNITFENTGYVDGNFSITQGTGQVINSGSIRKITFSTGDDLYDGRGGTVDFSLSMKGGDDTVHLDDNSSTARGGFGTDTAYLYASNIEVDSFEVIHLIGSEAVSYVGSVGSEEIFGNGQANTVNAAAGHDTLFGKSGNDTLLGNEGSDTVHGGSGEDLLRGGLGFDLLEGGADADIVRGGLGSDKLFGNSGDDVLHGGRGSDSVTGNSGSDTLIGGNGDDTLTGGRGSDTFIFEPGFGHDVIMDFDQNDTLELDLGIVGSIEEITELSSVNSEGFVQIEFSRSESITFNGILDLSFVVDAIDLI